MSTTDLLLEWYPLIIAAISTLIYIKSYFFKAKGRGGVQFLANNLLKDTYYKTYPPKMNKNTKNWLKRVSEVNEIIDKTNVQNINTHIYHGSPEIPLTFWQNILLIWILISVGITTFTIFNAIISPIWRNNWIVLPYFVYYIVSGTIFFLKGGK